MGEGKGERREDGLTRGGGRREGGAPCAKTKAGRALPRCVQGRPRSQARWDKGGAPGGLRGRGQQRRGTEEGGVDDPASRLFTFGRLLLGGPSHKRVATPCFAPPKCRPSSRQACVAAVPLRVRQGAIPSGGQWGERGPSIAFKTGKPVKKGGKPGGGRRRAASGRRRPGNAAGRGDGLRFHADNDWGNGVGRKMAPRSRTKRVGEIQLLKTVGGGR